MVGKIEPAVSGFNLFFFSGAEVANSYEHVFRPNGINYILLIVFTKAAAAFFIK